MLFQLPHLNSPLYTLFSNVERPSWLLAALEGRAIYELGAYFLTFPFLKSAPRGNGQPVLVIPGLMTSDLSTRPLRHFLKEQGYTAYGWEMGRNFGRDLHPKDGLKPDSQIFDHLREIRERHGQKVTLIGWSLGGLIARELSRQRTDDIQQVITLGSPFNGRNPHATNVEHFFEKFSGYRIDDFDEALIERAGMPPPVPSTAIYSKTDGIAAWECCIEEDSDMTENIGVLSSHFGLGHNPMVLWMIADRLHQIGDDWRPFARSGVTQFLYGNPAEQSLIW